MSAREPREPREPRVPSTPSVPIVKPPLEILPFSQIDRKNGANTAAGLTAGGAIFFLMNQVGFGNDWSPVLQQAVIWLSTVGFGFAAGFITKRRKAKEV